MKEICRNRDRIDAWFNLRNSCCVLGNTLFGDRFFPNLEGDFGELIALIIVHNNQAFKRNYKGKE